MISVIIPYYNAALWIKRCIDSLVSQSGDFEFIFVNDHSEDNGEEIAKQNADDRCVFLQNQFTKGVSGARNTGIAYARGEYLTFLDVDDEFLPNAYQKFTKILYMNVNIYQFNHLRYYTRINKLAFKFWNDEGWYNLNALPQAWYGVWNKLFKTSFVKDIKFDESLQYGEDGLFILNCLIKDNSIYHACKDDTIVKHRFDNKESLSHVKTSDDVIKQIHCYEQFLYQQTNIDTKAVVSHEIALLWDRVYQLLLKEKQHET